MKNPRFYMMVGVSGTNKSETAKLLSEKYDCVLISTDNIRRIIAENGNDGDYHANGIVHNTARKMLQDYVVIGKNIVFDANNIKVSERRKIFKIIESSKYRYDVFAVVKTRNRAYDDTMKVPKSILNRQISSFVMPQKAEGFTKVFVNRLPNCIDEFVLRFFKKTC